MNRSSLTLLTFILLISGCTGSSYYIASQDQDWRETQVDTTGAQQVFRLFLIGDTGGPQLGDEPDQTFRLLRQHLLSSSDSSAVVFLGDNVYCCGLPDSGSAGRPKAEAILNAHLDIVDGYGGKAFFIPGNHDWNDSRRGGLQSVLRQQRYLELHSGRGNIMIPSGGFPGPHVVELIDGISLVAIDTEWWLTRYSKPRGDTGEYEIREDEDFFLELEDVIVNELDDDEVIVVAHHPITTNGTHGGRLQSQTHLFPLTVTNRRAYFPLPVIGTIAVLYYRYFGGSRQDIQHPRYRALRDALSGIFSQHERLVYAAGHEHSLQYFRVGTEDQHQDYVVSGSGTKPNYVVGGHGATFTANPEGYSTIDYYDNHSVWLSFWDTSSDADEAQLLFRKKIKDERIIIEKGEEIVTEEVTFPDYTDSVAVVAINQDYRAGALKEFFLGSHHRELWALPVTAPYLDLGRKIGGLRPVKRGGGMQTISLRLEGADGKEYVLRSLDKDPSGTVPLFLQGTVATDIVQDQIASIHPYGAFILPHLERAAGIYHTNPELVYVPDDPRLGPFREAFANQLMMFEDRPDDDESDEESYGFSEDVESASTMYRKITEDNDDRVDQVAFARVRLFDMLIADWDRHRDQWRWASFDDPDGKGKLYRPIPRDRDWAFNRMNGVFPSLASQFDPKFQDFSESYGYLKGLTLNGNEQDRRLLNKLTREEWKSIAVELQSALTDSVIDAAVRLWPESVYELEGEKTSRLLKIRRDKLETIAEEYYEILARVIDVVGSDKHERVELSIASNEDITIHIDKATKEGEVRSTIYERTFPAEDTREIRIFGLDGNDDFVIRGQYSDINLRVIGGPGFDTIVNTSKTRVEYYDTFWSSGSSDVNVEPHIESNPQVNDYDPLDYRYNSRLPQVFFGHNSDDGIFIGGGMNFIRQSFRKTPFAKSHRIVANVAARTGAFNIDYQSIFTDISQTLDIGIHAFASSPATIYNFFGYGNETTIDVDSRQFYESRLTQFGLENTLKAEVDQGFSASFGPRLLVTKVREDNDRFIGQSPDIDPAVFETEYLLGFQGQIHIDNVDSDIIPKRGFRWYNSVSGNASATNPDNLYFTTSSDLRIYITPVTERLTFALRTGIDHIAGDFPYYESSTLGEGYNLRGYLKERFAGRTSFFQNAEARLELFRFSTYLATGRFGILGFTDNGRVWFDDTSSDTWHQGYGGGVWSNVLQIVTLSSWVAASEEGTSFSFKFGFHY